MIVVIVACEIAFWVFVVLGLLARYPLRRPRLGLVLLALTPVADVVLLVAAALDLRRGATAELGHGLAAVYLGISIAYGRRMVRWADERFAHRFAGGPAPVRLDGLAYAAHCWGDVARTLLAAGIAAGVVWLLTVVADDPARTAALAPARSLLLIVLAIDVVYAVSYTIWPRRPRARSGDAVRERVDSHR
ncbi:putative integral inner membrane protein [Nostocoides japonicum T1-X7]|uniref:Putative integral inner membrane protein n=1 Tax=Nostocoides japonicum T1-X7 TaxID=1194083 RepID=A0A077M007_9MICO|nr:hypothetical protein [Tetrasphaera japonica]CCH79593.1 putative integral inner membrane protein [Tetrasphaera japonica T1-X7]